MEWALDNQRQKLESLKSTKFKSNLTSSQYQALVDLRKDKSIIINTADKGSCVTVMSTHQYLEEGHKHLAQTHLYEHLNQDYTKHLAIEINQKLKALHQNKLLSDLQYSSLRKNPDDVRSQLLYFIRKVHKSPHQIRPIVSGIEGPTEALSALVDNILLPYVQECSHVIKNSTEVITILEATPLPTHSKSYSHWTYIHYICKYHKKKESRE